jgi:probable F420-dependent oxidoreductase
MTRLLLGVSLPSFGPHAGPGALAEVAGAAERLGFHSVVVTDRLLLPADPAWANEAGLPEGAVWDPIEVLTWVAAGTSRIRLATGVVNALFQPPVLLARRLATLDRLSGGRLDVGLGQGWLPEEFAAVGVPAGRRGRGFEEHLAVLRACWGPDPVRHGGPRYPLPDALVGPKPLQRPLPVRIGAVARPAVERAARIGDGFLTGVRDWDTSATEIGWYREAGGTGPVVLGVLPRTPDGAHTELTADAAVGDARRAVALGADELRWELNLSGATPARQVELLTAAAPALRAEGLLAP